MNKKDYEWYLNHYNIEKRRFMDELKNIASKYGTHGKITQEDIYRIKYCAEGLYETNVIYLFLIGIGYEFQKEEGDDNGNS